MNRYTDRINRVLDYIDQNISNELSLDELSEVSCFSKYHFARIFASIIGETLFGYIGRVRLQKAATMICGNRGMTISEIAASCGFTTSSSFAKSFRQKYGMSATQMRQEYLDGNLGQADSNLGTLKNKLGKELQPRVRYTEFNSTYNLWRCEMEGLNVEVVVKEHQSMPIAYVRHVGPYAGDASLFERLYSKLYSWAGPRGLVQSGKTREVCIYHDDPGLVQEDKLRTSVGITVDESTEVSGEVGKLVIPGGLYATGHFELEVDQFGQAWQFMCGSWLPSSGYEPDDRFCFEMYGPDSHECEPGKFVVDIFVPVRPLQNP